MTTGFSGRPAEVPISERFLAARPRLAQNIPFTIDAPNRALAEKRRRGRSYYMNMFSVSL
jgi:hypothetical protein